LLDVSEARMMKISASARPPSGAKGRKACRWELGDAVDAQQLATYFVINYSF